MSGTSPNPATRHIPQSLPEPAPFLAKLWEHAAVYPSPPAIQWLRDGRATGLDYWSLGLVIATICEQLKARGVGKGDCVIIQAENSPNWILHYLAVLFAGGTVVPLDTQFSPENTIRVIDSVKPVLAIVGKGGDAQVFAGVPVLEIPDFPEIALETIPSQIAPPLDRSGMTQVVIFTSGTTGEPKGVPLTDLNIATNIRDCLLSDLLLPGGRLLSVLPYHHAYSMTASVLAPLYGGITVCFSPIRPEDIRAAMAAMRPTHIVGVPRLLRLIADGMRRRLGESGFKGSVMQWLLDRSVRNEKQGRMNIASLFLFPLRSAFGGKCKYIVSGGARLDEDVYFTLKALGFAVHEGYGLTETSPILCLNPKGNTKAGKVGKPLATVDLKLFEEKNGLGEIAVRGPSVFGGYFERPDLTEKVIRDGWFFTGDLGRIDEDGFVSIEGRANEMLVTEGGKNIFPEETEQHFCTSRYISECCLFIHRVPGEASKLAVLVVPDLRALREDSVHGVMHEVKWQIAELSRSLPSYVRPAEVFLAMEELPRTRLGKIRRHLIPKMVTAEQEETDEPAQEMDAVTAAIASYVNKPSLKAEAHLEVDLGLDSLARMDLHSWLEQRFGAVDPELAAKAETVGEVSRLFGAANPTTERPVSELPKIPPRTWLKSAVQRVVGGLFNMWLAWKLPLDIKRVELPLDRPFILAPNHNSLLDAFVLRLAVAPGLRSAFVFLSIGLYFEKLWLRPVAWVGRIVVMGRKDTPADAFRVLKEAIRQGNPIVVFPEGERSAHGRLQAPRPGAFKLALDTGVPLYPVVIRNIYGYYSRGGEPGPAPITVQLLDPIDPREFPGTGREAEEAFARRWSEAMQKAIGDNR